MPSPDCERAIEDALNAGNALLKFISANDAGLTGSHQAGFYMPKPVWQMYAPFPPKKGRNDKHPIEITWPDGRITKSVITWYGSRTRQEYRLTCFGKNFPYLTTDNVGNLLVLVIHGAKQFSAFVLDNDDDIEDIQVALGLETFEHWGVFRDGEAAPETENDCIERKFRDLVAKLSSFPTGEWFSTSARDVLQDCISRFLELTTPDSTLIRCCESEYRLFQVAERHLCAHEVTRPFKDIDDFLRTAARIMNRRKARAGRSLENHIDFLLTKAHVPHEMRPHTVDGKPDIVIPGSAEYNDASFPLRKLFVVGVKTTCKDRWRQITREGKRVRDKHILTIQPGISTNQLQEMRADHMSLVVPKQLHRTYKPPSGMRILTITSFIDHVRRQLVR